VANRIKANKQQVLKIEDLEFDRKNPRLTEENLPENASDAEIIGSLADSADLFELIESIATNGYIDIEPLIVLQAGGKYCVLEGNRRLAVLKLLRSPELARSLNITLPEVAPDVAATLEAVTTYIVDSREEAREFIGFKHINGPHKWDALSKARFTAEWYRLERENGVTLRKIAKQLGDRHDTVQRLVSGFLVLEQAEKQRLFDAKDRYAQKVPFAFSHLYTALTRPGYRDFLGLPENWRRDDPSPGPVPLDKSESLAKVMRWLYGSHLENIEPVIQSQNPNLRQLDRVLQSPTARLAFLQTNNLRDAYAMVDSSESRFEVALIGAKQNAETALGQIGSYREHDDTLLKLASELHRTTRVIHNTMAAATEGPAEGED
jgi:hypothetical protein